MVPGILKKIEDIETILFTRDSKNGGDYWFHEKDSDFPTLAIKISANNADVHFFPENSHPGFRYLNRDNTDAGNTIFVFDGCDPSNGEETPNEFVISISIAIDIAKRFYLKKLFIDSEEWFEL